MGSVVLASLKAAVHKLPTRAAPALLLFLQVVNVIGSEFKGGLLGLNKILASMHENIIKHQIESWPIVLKASLTLTRF